MGLVAIVPFPLPAGRTGRAVFPHPALRPASREGMRRVGTLRLATKLVDTEVPEDALSCELPGPTRADGHDQEDPRSGSHLGSGYRDPRCGADASNKAGTFSAAVGLTPTVCAPACNFDEVDGHTPVLPYVCSYADTPTEDDNPLARKIESL